MNLQDLIAYCLMGVLFGCFVYIAWASRQGGKGSKDEKNK